MHEKKKNAVSLSFILQDGSDIDCSEVVQAMLVRGWCDINVRSSQNLRIGSHKDGGLRTGEETVTEERIQLILSEASRAMTSGTVSGGTGLGPIPQLPQPKPQPPPSQQQSQQQPHQQQQQQQQQSQQTSHQPSVPVPGIGVDQDSRSTDSKSPASSIHSPR